MKPLSLNAEREINDAVEAAINAGMTPKEFVAAVREVWAEVLRELGQDAERAFAAMERAP